MRHNIQILYHPIALVPVASIETKVLDQDFSARCTEQDKKIIDEVWQERVLKKNPKATSKPRGRANLVSTNFYAPDFSFEYAEYKEYQAVTNTALDNPRPLSDALYDTMRIAAVGAALVLPDDTVLVHRRPFTATHVAGVFDSSTAGVLPVDDTGVHIEQGLYEKLSKELGIQASEVTLEGVTGTHSAGSPDFSGLVTVLLRSHLSREEVEQRIKPGTFPEVRYVPRAELADFVFDRYTANDMNHDGAMTLLSSLPYTAWRESIARLETAGKTISEGILLSNGHFTTRKDYHLRWYKEDY